MAKVYKKREFQEELTKNLTLNLIAQISSYYV